MSDETAYKITVSGQDEAKFWDLFEAGEDRRTGHYYFSGTFPSDLMEKFSWMRSEFEQGIMLFNVEYDRGNSIVAMALRGTPDGLFYADRKWHLHIPAAGFEKLKLHVEIVGGGLFSSHDGSPWSYKAIVENGKLVSREYVDSMSLLEGASPHAVEMLRDLHPLAFVDKKAQRAAERAYKEYEQRALEQVDRLWPTLRDGDVVDVTTEDGDVVNGVVQKTGETWVLLREHMDIVDGVNVFSGPEWKRWKKDALRLAVREKECPHGQDVRASIPCGECRLSVMVVIDGVRKRVVS